MSKKKKTVEELLEEALVPEEEQPYEVLENWTWVKFDSVIKTSSGRANAVKQKNYEEEGEIPVIDQGKRLISGFTNNPEDVYTGELPVIIFGDHTRCLKWIDFKFAQGADGTKVLNPLEKFYPKYFYYLLKTVNLPDKGYSRHFKYLKDSTLPIPPFNEQKRITEKVERLLSKSEEAKQLIEEVKETITMQFNAVLNKAFNGDLTSQWRKRKNSKLTRAEFVTQLKNERIKLCKTNKNKEYYNECFQSLLEQPKGLPDGWIIVTFELICDNITKGTTPKATEITPEGDVPFLKVYNIVNNKIDFEYKPGFIPKMVNENKLKRSIVYPGDVLMNIVGPPLGKVAIVPPTYPEWNINQAIAIFRPIKGVLKEYIYYSLLYEKTLVEVFQETRGVVGQSNISLEQCRKLKVALPPLDEQKEIVKAIKYTFEKLKIVENNIDYLNGLLEKTAESVMTKAFRGELGTNDPSEENAIELLKEILQEQVK
ncbi:TPA: restriction endonuclease subunit S [Bacillus cereus]|nr:restriction endonuclease subunit S [Bacillus cereus]HDR8251958.1 restriction endonuclease subunit S [Bacillus cereus]